MNRSIYHNGVLKSETQLRRAIVLHRIAVVIAYLILLAACGVLAWKP